MTQETNTQAEEQAQSALPDEQAETSAETQEEPAETPDYQALYEMEQVARVKLENDAKAAQGRLNPIQDAIQPLMDRMDANDRTMGAFIESFASGDTDGLLGKVETIQTEARRTAAGAEFQKRHDVMFENMKTSVLDSEGKPMFDLMTDPNFNDVRVAWNEAQKNGSIRGLAEVQNTVHQRVIAEERVRAKTALKEAQEQAKASKQKMAKETGVLDVEIGNGTAIEEEPAWKKLTPTQQIKYALDQQTSEEGKN